MTNARDHITVCICTYKRLKLLEHLLSELQNQITEELFTYSIVVVDNDYTWSARTSVESFNENSIIDIEYYNEPRQNIALARNKAVDNAKGNFIAFIDDDEFPDNDWLLNLYKVYGRFKADGVLGPVKAYYETVSPTWVKKGKFYETPSRKTGFVLSWQNTRTSNVLVRRDIFERSKNMFAPAFGSGGEDRDFFRRMIDKGHTFVWCAEAPVHETIPPDRCKRIFMLKRALLRGQVSLLHPSFGFLDIIKSGIAVLMYSFALPILLLLGHHIFIKYLVKDFDHIGRLLAVCGFYVVKEKYVMK